MIQPFARAVALAALACFGASAHATLVPSTSLGTVTAPDSRVFGDFGFGPGTVNGESGSYSSGIYNFLDEFSFTLSPAANVAALAASINFRDASNNNVLIGVSNLQVNLSGPSGMFVSWRNVAAPTSGLSTEVALIHGTPLAEGAYTLRVRGTVTGSGSYAGALIASPVPLPAVAPMMLAGLGAFGVAALRRRRQAA